MPADFLSLNQDELLARCHECAIRHDYAHSPGAELERGVRLLMDQAIQMLRDGKPGPPRKGSGVSGPAGCGEKETRELEPLAANQGEELPHRGFTVEEMLYDHFILCRAMGELAFSRNENEPLDVFFILKLCLDNEIAIAVKESSGQPATQAAGPEVKAMHMQLDSIGRELRNNLNLATRAFLGMKGGNLSPSGATGALLDRALVSMRVLIDRSLTEARMAAGLPVRRQLFALAEFMAELKASAALEASIWKRGLIVGHVAEDLALYGDRDLLQGAVGNLLQNAFKFTYPGTEVILSAHGAGENILIELQDDGPGLPSHEQEKLAMPLIQEDINHSGTGLGLSIARRIVEANGGSLTNRQIPGEGCRFIISLPRQVWPVELRA